MGGEGVTMRVEGRTGEGFEDVLQLVAAGGRVRVGGGGGRGGGGGGRWGACGGERRA